jgi:hypothetical protein
MMPLPIETQTRPCGDQLEDPDHTWPDEPTPIGTDEPAELAGEAEGES